MRYQLFAVLAVTLSSGACKDNDADEAAPVKPTAKVEARPETKPEVQATVSLPADFPLPATAGRKLVRFHDRLSMTTWQYDYPDLAPADVIAKLRAGMTMPAFAVGEATSDGAIEHLFATHGGRQYAIAAARTGAITALTIRSFPEAGPTTTPAPPIYPTKFPFLAGGTASHARDGNELKIAYQTAAADVELALVLAARRGGWQCTGGHGKPTTCTQNATTVAFTTQDVPGGSLLSVSTR